MKFAQDVVVLIVGIGMMTWPHEATAKNNKAITLTPIGATAPALGGNRGESAASAGDNKGPKPEAAVIGKVFGRTYAFIGLERAGGIMVYDISNPFDPFFVDYVNTSPIDIAPEGLVFIEDESPNGKALLVVSHEVSNTTSIFEINKD